MKLLRRGLLFVLALVFLLEAWIWDTFAAGWRWLGKHVPFQAARAALERGIRRLPPYAALVMFAVPGLVVLPFKVAGLWLIAQGHIVLGAGVFFAAKVAGVGVLAFVFELIRDKLMTLGWFSRIYGAVMRWRDWAHRLVDPYTRELKAQLASLRARIRGAVAAERSRLTKTILRLRQRIRRSREQG